MLTVNKLTIQNLKSLPKLPNVHLFFRNLDVSGHKKKLVRDYIRDFRVV